MDLLNFLQDHAPCYIYDGEKVESQCRKLKDTLFGFDFLYSVKTNAFPPMIQGVAKEGFGADAASSREVELALENGIAPEQVFYSSPGKTDQDIEASFGKCVLIADSISEVRWIHQVAARRGETAEIGIRVNPDFTMLGDRGCASKFGVDTRELLASEAVLDVCTNVRIIGIHVHIQSQILDYQVLGRYYQNCFALARRIQAMNRVWIKFINFESGIGALYREELDHPVDLEKLAGLAAAIVDENDRTRKAKLYIETGRFIGCNAGKYYTKIVDIKESYGQKYLIVENAMNGFMRPAIANLLTKATEQSLPGYEPLYTCQNEFAVRVLNQEDHRERVHIIGNLCTALDVICENVEVNHARVGDTIEITNAGSYGYSLSPLLFSGHAAPGQYYVFGGKIFSGE